MSLDFLLQQTLAEMKGLYLRDATPWVVGFSGGKDSSTVVQLVYSMLLDLAPEHRHKTVHVIASDTLVESPVVEKFLDETIEEIRQGIAISGIPMVVEKVSPNLNETFWVNLIGRGYPAPNRFFRWCTERLKINPSTRYIQKQIDEFGEVIILLGARKDESGTRAQVLENHQIHGNIRRHSTMAQAVVYTPIADWSTEDVWMYLSAFPTPWDYSNKSNLVLRELYKDASGECPLVIDTTTPSCGQSRFGCWTCTVVSADKSMKGFLDSGKSEYAWMKPLLDFRDKLKMLRDDPSRREPWRRNSPSRPRGWAIEMGEIKDSHDDASEQVSNEQLGPFTLETRQELLRELLLLQRSLQKHTGRPLIREDELEMIQQAWVEDYRVNPFAVLDIIEEIYGPVEKRRHLDAERSLLEEVCDEHGVDILVLDRLLDIERGFANKLRKRGLHSTIDEIIDDLVTREKLAKNVD